MTRRWDPSTPPGRGAGHDAPVWVTVAISTALVILVVIALGNVFR